MQPFTYRVGGIDGAGIIAPWPLVCKIDFGLDHPLLKEGVIFVDSPRLSDTNTARSRNAINQHRQWTHIISVAHVGRAEDDLTLRKVLESGYRTRGSGETMHVLTRGDSIDAGTEVIGAPSEKKRMAKLDAGIKVLRDQKKKVLCPFWTEEYKGSLAIMKKNGMQKSKKKGKEVNWNTDLQKIGRETLEAFFGDFRKISRAWTDHLSANVLKLCDEPRNAIEISEVLRLYLLLSSTPTIDR